MTLVVAHRGAGADAPENTMLAYQLAVDMGADAIEIDVHLTSDGKLALIHDETLDRTTNLTGPVVGKTLAQIRRGDAGYHFAASDGSFPFRGKKLKVPTLDEVLKWLPAGIGLVVEIKAREATAATITALRTSKVRAAGAVSVISFDEVALEQARELDPEIPTGYLLVPFQSPEVGLTFAVEHGHTGVHPWEGDLGLDPAPFMYLANAYGRQVGCYVVNDPERMQQLAAAGLWGFVTDLPGLARVALGPRGATAGS